MKGFPPIDTDLPCHEDPAESTPLPNTPLYDVSSDNLNLEKRKLSDVTSNKDDISDDIPTKRNFFDRVSGKFLNCLFAYKQMLFHLSIYELKYSFPFYQEKIFFYMRCG